MRAVHYDYLQSVRETGDWESWIRFFLEGVIETANKAVKNTKDIIELFTEDHQKIQDLGRPAASALLVHHYLEKHSVTDIEKISAHCNITIPTTTKSIKHLETLGIAKEITGKERYKIYIYQRYLDILRRNR
ncbi:hypothetical protein [Candidatus Coxiella mudrowiae]|uniref:hypothetical protein n=1 Tax=Candidatus Coxiella mudrowiae TaxID=2054173 RepID=UPI001910D67E|nr:hypothetical protein [Candidatus Coxiella mudrowiae]